jgi:hypothetical protein
MRVRHERGKLILHTEELVHGIVVPLPFFAFDLLTEKPIQHMGREPLGRRLPIERVFMQLRQIFFPSVNDLLLVRGRLVAQFPVVTSDTELFHQAERGKQFRLAENRFRKNFLIEKIQAPRPEPDEIDQENRERDDNDRRDSEKPLQQALEHVFHQRVNGERVNENFAGMKSATR